MRTDPVIALVTSAGGVGALATVLRDLPAGLPMTVVVQQHLSARGSSLVKILQSRSDHDVVWAEDGIALTEDRVVVCPPRRRLEVLPDGTCALITNEPGARSNPHDALLRSLADTYGSRAVAVVLTGMGRDGAVGAATVREAGGLVVAQSEDSAEFASMPKSAAGSAHLVLPLGHIGGVLADLARGRPLPRPRSEIEAAAALFRGPGEVERGAAGQGLAGHAARAGHRVAGGAARGRPDHAGLGFPGGGVVGAGADPAVQRVVAAVPRLHQASAGARRPGRPDVAGAVVVHRPDYREGPQDRGGRRRGEHADADGP
ncbi:chemotaxis protein CheB [Actinoplanes philippinensis]|uniref:chemotaxis protein CheB n=1 Tax=Actinoplanes philippinensis TaxID=35752 RepID=UPI001EF3219A|nr:chemotaxis protein CheB [Actinoplanes philippinensis]